ncbi:unnamed protein product [Diplocarpon coronariae]
MRTNTVLNSARTLSPTTIQSPSPSLVVAEPCHPISALLQDLDLHLHLHLHLDRNGSLRYSSLRVLDITRLPTQHMESLYQDEYRIILDIASTAIDVAGVISNLPVPRAAACIRTSCRPVGFSEASSRFAAFSLFSLTPSLLLSSPPLLLSSHSSYSPLILSRRVLSAQAHEQAHTQTSRVDRNSAKISLWPPDFRRIGPAAARWGLSPYKYIAVPSAGLTNSSRPRLLSLAALAALAALSALPALPALETPHHISNKTRLARLSRQFWLAIAITAPTFLTSHHSIRETATFADQQLSLRRPRLSDQPNLGADAGCSG